jgi:hypothetical protein
VANLDVLKVYLVSPLYRGLFSKLTNKDSAT